MNFRSMKLSMKLGLSFAAVVLLSMMGSALGVYKLQAIHANLTDIVTDNNVKLALNHTMSESVHIVARVSRTLVLLNDAAVIATERKKIDAARAEYDSARKKLETMPASELGRTKREAIWAAQAKARDIVNQVLELAQANKDAEAVELLLKQAGPATTAWQAALDDNIQLQEKHTEEEYQRSVETYHAARNLMIGFAVLAALAAAALATLTVRSLVAELGGEPADAMRVAAAIADGDLGVEVTVRPGDQRSVMLAMRTMRDRLAEVVGQVRRSSDSIATGSSQIATGNADLSQRTEEQASNLQQTAASMEQLTSTVKANADTAHQANQLAAGASAAALKGGEVVGQVVATMQQIAGSSKKISDIIGTIDGIAFQTNILALNAAVEAARAGEQGRGFAVVASEVRSLAQRSANAAKEIKALIGDSVERVEIGARQVHDAGESMNDIVRQVQHVTQLIGEISTATVEQSSGIGQVGDAVSQLDQVTQQNAALVEESAAAAESLRVQAARLAEVVSVFNLAPQQAHA